MQNIYGAIKLLIFLFSIAPCKVFLFISLLHLWYQLFASFLDCSSKRSCCSFSLIEAIAKNFRCWEAMQKRSHEPNYKTIKKWSKEVKSNNLCYRTFWKMVMKWGAIDKSSILLSQYWKIPILIESTKNYFAF